MQAEPLPGASHPLGAAASDQLKKTHVLGLKSQSEKHSFQFYKNLRYLNKAYSQFRV